MQLTLLHQDSELVIADKPSGLLSVPGRGPDKQDCVVNRVKEFLPDIIAQPAVHRLDMYTSGIMLLARTRNAHRELSRQFEQRRVHKRYVALVQGVINETEGEIRLAFRLAPDNRPYQVYDPIQGKPGITRWKRLGVEGSFTRIEFTPLTGRTHQLRLHAAHPKGLGAPIVGDRLYGDGKEGGPMCLHASRIAFHHPKDGRPFKITSEIPF
ncbi:MAG: RluA family pseudouridine synthase [Desulfobacteraceae bacterium]|jgi:tRNA pseudouridine32 synthase / 23S rRNA pseudouridine746 synthase